MEPLFLFFWGAEANPMLFLPYFSRISSVAFANFSNFSLFREGGSNKFSCSMVFSSGVRLMAVTEMARTGVWKFQNFLAREKAILLMVWTRFVEFIIFSCRLMLRKLGSLKVS